ncbi:Ger(x)C family spore germination protein [Alkalicoccobacillus porphyridii]|uniref:Ger(x)C family spore germination protein n=1 Tax=Alkalicoccobacillus porphyridii TaxID=2597270 RepID=UPI00163DA626|nr:Ger(x)C family spore germination protein [Alkalicoccobacillus porphyridii]
MNIRKQILGCLFLTVFLSGCWDEQLLKDVALINSQAFDLDSDHGLIQMTIAVVSGNSNEKIPTTTTIIAAEGNSVRDARTELDKKIGSELFASKNQVTLFSKKLAKKDIYAVLDGNYRSPLSALTARLAVVEEQAGEALHVQTENKPLISDYLQDVLMSAEETGSIPVVSLQNTLSVLYDNDQDLILPTVEVLENHSGIKLTGSALFNGRRMTGEINSDETIMLLLLDGSANGEHRMTKKVHSMGYDDLYDFITVDVEKLDRNFTLTKNDQGQFEAQIDLILKLDANEYPADHLYKESIVKKVNTELSEQFTKQANEVLKKIQEANCDYLAIGRQVRAFYYEDWQQLDWNEAYPTIKFKANVTAEIIYHGIIN